MLVPQSFNNHLMALEFAYSYLGTADSLDIFNLQGNWSPQ